MAEPDEDSSISSVPGLVAGLGELESILVGTDAIDEVVWETAMLAVRADSGAEECGVTVLRDGLPRSLYPDAATHSAIEAYQYSADDGPIMQAIRTRERVLVGSMDDENRWDEYPSRATADGVLSSLTLPLVAGGQVLGAITFYSSNRHAFTTDFLLGGLVADLAATGLWCLLKHADRGRMEDQLQEALLSRATIDQAKGILMARERCSPDEAFDLLRRSSQNHNAKLRDLASRIVDRAASTNGSSGQAGRE